MSDQPERKVFERLPVIGNGIEEVINEIAGENMGFTLMIFPLDRPGVCSFITNAKREDAIRVIRTLLQQMESGQTLGFDVVEAKKH